MGNSHQPRRQSRYHGSVASWITILIISKDEVEIDQVINILNIAHLHGIMVLSAHGIEDFFLYGFLPRRLLAFPVIRPGFTDKLNVGSKQLVHLDCSSLTMRALYRRLGFIRYADRTIRVLCYFIDSPNFLPLVDFLPPLHLQIRGVH
jgi:hypothetical protein